MSGFSFARLACLALPSSMLLFGGCAAPEAGSGIDRMAELHDRLLGSYRDSAVTVKYYFRNDDRGRPPEFQVFYYCPNCQTGHNEWAARLVDEQRPFRTPGYLIGPDRVVASDVRFRPEWLDRIEVVSESGMAAAEIAGYYPEQGSVLLATDAPVPGGRALEFGGGEGALFDFYIVPEMLTGVSGVTPHNPGRFSEIFASGYRTLDYTPVNVIVSDAAGTAVALSMTGETPVNERAGTPPAMWRFVTAEARARETEALVHRLGQAIFPVKLRFAEEEQNSPSARYYYGGDESDETTEVDTIGILLESGDMLLPAAVPPTLTARLESIVFAAGEERRAEFVGSLKEYGMLVARPADGFAGPGLKLYSGDPEMLYMHPAYAVRAVNYGEEFDLAAQPTMVESFGVGFRELLIPLTRDGAEFNLLFTVEGELMGCQGELRSVARTGGAAMIPSGALAFAMAGDYDSRNIPLAPEERRRIAWLGVAVQPLDSDLARDGRVSNLTADGTNGLLINKIYPGSPAESIGLAPGDILLKVTALDDGVTTLLVGGEYGGFGMGNPLWEYYDEIPEQHYDMLPLPWAGVKSPLSALLTRIGIGSKVELGYISGGKMCSAELVLSAAPTFFETAPRYNARELGITVADLTFEVRDYFKLAADDPGVIVARVRSGSRASIAGVMPYELITQVDSTPVRDIEQFRELVSKGGEIRLEVRRLSQSRIVTITAGKF